MFRIIYDALLFVFGVATLPKLIWNFCIHKKYRRSLAARVGLKIPNLPLKSGGSRIWIHAVSVGETRAVSSLLKKIQKEVPEASIFFSTTTETGQEEARRLYPDLAGYFFLPLDFSWIIRRFVPLCDPHLLILVESDFWYNIVTSVPQVVVVNGKMSVKSQHRFQWVQFFTKRLFSPIHLFCLQSERYRDRFLSLGIDPQKLVVTGNLKFDTLPLHIDTTQWRQTLGILPEDRVVTVGSTHANEEEEILKVLEPLMAAFPHLKILIVPRHPERFSSVAGMLEKKGIAFSRYSEPQKMDPKSRVVLVDAMGVLSSCYQVSELAIVGGSFVTHVGGHNIFEPAAFGVPVLFGPHMHTQKDLTQLILQAEAGVEVTLDQLASTVYKYLQNPPLDMRQAGLQLAKEIHGATDRTWEALKPFLL
jgi:3-deoxy-D-manno-octulosonic-acid transferase